MKKKAYLALGSNIGDPATNIKQAIDALNRVPGIKIDKISSFLRTKPWGYADQKDFINACASVETELSPESLLGGCLGIEAGLGRIRKIKNGPRLIDIDLIIYEGITRNTNELVLPHPRYRERDFVLRPLSEIVEGQLKDSVLKDLESITDKYVYSKENN